MLLPLATKVFWLLAIGHWTLAFYSSLIPTIPQVSFSIPINALGDNLFLDKLGIALFALPIGHQTITLIINPNTATS